ncbi:MAG: hypothetical protein AAFY34_14150 [Pseudomonadota bacterium]
MSRQRVIAICLDAFDVEFSNAMIERGLLPGLAKCRDVAARFKLQHGDRNTARDSGLTGEHVATGLSPETTGRWSPLLFDTETYTVRQKFTQEVPYFAQIGAKCVVLDATYFDLKKAPNCQGLVGWSGHDPGILPYARPEGLRNEVDDMFGDPVDTELLNQNVYSDTESVRLFSAAVEKAARQRTDVAKWLLTERFQDWDVALIAFSEGHDGIEQLYHGVAPDHHLSSIDSAQAAKDGLEAIYTAISEGIETLMETLPDATFAVFTMHGMGENQTDIPSMLLLPELMYRLEFGRPYFRSRKDWADASAAQLAKGEDWTTAITNAQNHPIPHYLAKLPGKLAGKVRRKSQRLLSKVGLCDAPDINLAEDEFDVDWIPAIKYREYWPKMQAFGMPGLFDGRVRVNLKNRERQGIVERHDYHRLLDNLEATLKACRDPKTGEPVVAHIDRPGEQDPFALNESQSDLHVTWKGNPLAFSHPDLGVIGPAPLRRVGGHTGQFGALYLIGKDIPDGDYGIRSSFDIAPTIVDLVGAVQPNRLDGKSVLQAMFGPDLMPSM